MTRARVTTLPASGLAVALVAMVLTGAPSVAAAQPAAESEAQPEEAPDETPAPDEPGDETPPEATPKAGKSPAETLFDRGLEDMLAGHYETACPALAESFRLDPAPGALFTLAECEMGSGRLATAQTHYRDYLDRVEHMTEEGQARQQQRVDVAKDKLAELEGKVPTLTLRLPMDAPADVVVKRDGELVAPAMLGQPLPVDPGEYTITVEGPDRRSTEQRVSVKEGGREDLLLLVGRQSDPPLHGMEVGAIIAGSVGLAGLVGGTIAGAVAVGKKGTIDDECVNRQCTQKGLDAVDAGQAAGTASTVLLIIGAVGAGAAVTLWFLAPADAGSSPADDRPDQTDPGGAYGISSLGLELTPRFGAGGNGAGPVAGGTVGLSLSF